MKRSLLFSLTSLIITGFCISQNVEYRTYIYTSDNLADDIRRANENQDDTRRFDMDLLNASLDAARGIGGGYVVSIMDMGVNALGNLITRNARMKKEWESIVNEENSWSMNISTIQDVKDFYKKPSTAGALDPLNMNFDGIGCMRMEGPDTVFFISCHIDRTKLNRIVNHSKFELVLDSLIVNPYKSNLPNTQLPIEFDFDERGDFILSIKIRLTSSWFTDAIELHNDAYLGEFSLTVPICKDDVNSDGTMRYTRPEDEEAKYRIVGESFIVPRSYMGYRDSNGKYKNIWGTGQYKLDMEITESCRVTPQYRDRWKADMKKRKKMVKKTGLFPRVWQTVTSQHWDEITRSWIITTIAAPAGVASNEIIKDLDLKKPQSPNAAKQATPSVAGPVK